MLNSAGTIMKSAGTHTSGGYSPFSHTGLVRVGIGTLNFNNLTNFAAGTYVIVGTFQFKNADSGATLEMQLGGSPDTGMFGQLNVDGTAQLAGTLLLTPVNNYQPMTDDAFLLLTKNALHVKKSIAFRGFFAHNSARSVNQMAISL